MGRRDGKLGGRVSFVQVIDIFVIIFIIKSLAAADAAGQELVSIRQPSVANGRTLGVSLDVVTQAILIIDGDVNDDLWHHDDVRILARILARLA